MKKRNQYLMKYHDEHYDRIVLNVPKGVKARLQEEAKAAGKSLNAYIVSQISGCTIAVTGLIETTENFTTCYSDLAYYTRNDDTGEWAEIPVGREMLGGTFISVEQYKRMKDGSHGVPGTLELEITKKVK